jgi:hypothetical protein
MRLIELVTMIQGTGLEIRPMEGKGKSGVIWGVARPGQLSMFSSPRSNEMAAFLAGYKAARAELVSVKATLGQPVVETTAPDQPVVTKTVRLERRQPAPMPAVSDGDDE